MSADNTFDVFFDSNSSQHESIMTAVVSSSTRLGLSVMGVVGSGSGSASEGECGLGCMGSAALSVASGEL